MKARNATQHILKTDRLNITLQNQFKDFKKHIKSLLHKTKQKYYHSQIITSNNDIASTWQIVNKAIPYHKSKSSINVTENALSKAESFNTFFANVGKETFEKT